MKRVLVLAFALLVAVLAGAPNALGATLCSDLPSAIANAQDGDTVTAPAGTCQVNVTTTNTNTFTLQADPAGSTLEPATANVPILSDHSGPHITISGITFTGMSGNVALSTYGGSVTLIGDTFSDNSGGAAQLLTADSVTISGSSFTNNTGALDGTVDIGGKPAISVTGSTFSGNSAVNTGGALSISNGFGDGSAPIVVTGNTFERNSAGIAGGAVSLSASHAQPVTIAGNTFKDNLISGSGAMADRVGAGLVVAVHADDTTFHVQQAGNLFSGNSISATADPGSPNLRAGGAGEWVSGAAVTSTGDVFENNTITVDDGAPPEGAGLGVLGLPPTGSQQPASPGAFAGTQDLFRGNTAPAGAWGGAIYVGGPVYTCRVASCPGSSIALADSTIVGNSVAPGTGSEGGALWGSPNDTLALANSIVFGNSAGPGQPDVFGFGTPSVQFSDVCAAFGGSAPLAGAGNICADPLLAPDGKETVSSPTIDAGSNALVPPGLGTDLAGGPRVVAGRVGCSGPLPAVVDMGAFEAPAGPAPPCPPPIPAILGTAHASRSGASVVFTCGAGGPCRVSVWLRTTERRRGHKVLSLASRRHHHKRRIRRKSVLVGHRTSTVAAGAQRKLAIPLNHTGKKLLARFHRLPVRLSVKMTTGSGAQATFGTRRLTIKAPKRHKRHKRHHHR